MIFRTLKSFVKPLTLLGLSFTVLCAQPKTDEATALNRLPIRDWLFEQITEAGFDVQDDVVITPELPPQQS